MDGEKAEEEKEEIMTFFLWTYIPPSFKALITCLLKVKFDM